MSDIFGATNEFGGVFKGSTFKVADGGALVQSISVQYQRQINRIWELGSLKQYYVEGHTEGQGTIGHIIGPEGLINKLVSEFSDICKENRTLTLQAATSTCGKLTADDTSIVLGGVLCQMIGIQSSSQDHMINSSMQVMFTSLRDGSSAA